MLRGYLLRATGVGIADDTDQITTAIATAAASGGFRWGHIRPVPPPPPPFET